MANPWFRLYAEFANDAKVQMLSESDQRRLLMLFCFRCNGNVTLQDEEVTFQLRISNDQWAATKAIFTSKGFINEHNEVLNWDKRQYISDSSAARVAKHRKNKKQECNVTVTPPDTDTDTDTDQSLSKEDVKCSVGATKAAPDKKNGASLPKNWVLPKKWGEWALAERPDWTADDVRRVADQYKDHWIANSNQRNGKKADWEAAWRNWVRKEPPAKNSQQQKNGKPWFLSASGIEAKGIELNVLKGTSETFPNYRLRVYAKAGLSEESDKYRKAILDYGE